MPEEETRLRTVLGEHYPHRIPEFEIGLNTGMRKSEQFHAISAENIDFDVRVLTIPETKNGPERHIALNDIAVVAFEKVVQIEQSVLFWNCDGEQLSDPRAWFERAIELAGIKNFHWHDLRHTFASRLVMEGVDLRTVQVLMGHQTIEMTMRYAHLSPTHTLAAVQRLCDTAKVRES